MKPFNVLIAGIGGQGVVTLNQVMIDLCEQKGIFVQGSIYKGGAQQLGSIHSILRLFQDKTDDARNYSLQLLDGDLDLMLGLEPWETLRYSRYFSRTTKVVSNSRIVPIETERYQKKEFKNPCKQLMEKNLNLTLSDFSSEAIRRFGTKKMVNFVIAERAALDKLIPFSQEEIKHAFKSRGLKVEEQVNNSSKEELDV